MKFKSYFREHLPFLVVNIILYLVVCLLLFMIDTMPLILLWIFCIWFIPVLVCLGIDYVKKKRMWNKIEETLSGLDKKYLFVEMLPAPSTVEEELLYSVLRQTNKAMCENVNEYKNAQLDYKEYIEAWVHEVKTPIASAKLIIDNHPSEQTTIYLRELDKIEGFVNQALYFARSSHVEKDYIIGETDLRSVVNAAVRANYYYLREKQIQIDVDAVQDFVYSDRKWLEFIVSQLIVNAAKYCRTDSPHITIRSKKDSEFVKLFVADNGIGIPEQDVTRVFDKGFTGANGRLLGRSTGMGLYLCEKLCLKLGHCISISSTQGEGTEVTIKFPFRDDHK